MPEDLTFNEKIWKVMETLELIEKRGYNKHHEYHYATAEDVILACNRAFRKFGLRSNCQVEALHVEPGHSILKLTLQITDGENVMVTQGVGEGTDKGDKAAMKACKAAMKYCLTNGFLIATGDKSDEAEADENTDKTAEVVAEYVMRLSRAKNTQELTALGEEVGGLPAKYKLSKSQTNKLRKAWELRAGDLAKVA